MCKDWWKAQSEDHDISFIVDHLIEGHKPSSSEAHARKIDNRMIADWTKYHLKDRVLYKTITLSDEEFDQICLPHSLRDEIFHAYHTDLGHQGRDRTLSMIKRRFFSPGLDNFIKQRIQTCGRCIRR